MKILNINEHDFELKYNLTQRAVLPLHGSGVVNNSTRLKFPTIVE